MAALWYALLWLAAIPTQHTQAHARPLRAPAGYHMTAAGACRLGRLLACHRPRILWFCTITNTHQDFDTHHSSPRESLRAAPWRPPCRCYFKLGDHALLGAARGRLAAARRARARAPGPGMERLRTLHGDFQPELATCVRLMTLTLPLEPFLSTPCQPVCAAFACRVCGGGGAGGPCRGSCRLTCICVLLLLDSTSHGGWPRRVVKRGGILREHASLHTARHYTRHICITAHRLRRPQRWTALGQKRKPPRPAGTCGCTCSRAWQPSTPVTRPRRARACWCGRRRARVRQRACA